MNEAGEWLLQRGDTLQVALFFPLLAALAAAEMLIPRRTHDVERRRRWPTNFGLTLVNFIALSAMPISMIAAAGWARARGWGLLNLVDLGAWAILVTLLVRAFISFLTHYLMHAVPFLWRLHRVHHLDTELDVSTTVRFHPLEFVVQVLPAIPIALLFGLTPWVLMLYELLDIVVTLWSHSNTRVPRALERILRIVVVTPDVHRVHHSAWRTETNSNFGAVFPIWDIVFGTFRPEPRDPHERMMLGLGERGPDTQHLGRLLLSPFEGAFRGGVEDRRTDRPRG